MRRTIAEWLLLPLLLAPAAAGVGLALYARHSYRAATAPYRREGRRLAQRELAEDPARAEWFLERFRSAYGPGSRAFRDLQPYGRFTDRVGDGLVDVGSNALGKAPVLIASSYPEGLKPGALADPKVRLEVETGTPPAQTDGVGPATRTFAALYEHPDLERLRNAPLPADMKLFLVQRRLSKGPAGSGWRAMAALLRAVSGLEDRESADAGPLPPGVHELGKSTVLSFGADRPRIVLPRGRSLAGPRVLVDPASAGDLVRLAYMVSGPAPGDVAWSGDVVGALQGTYAFLLPYGNAWWRTPAFSRWAGPVAAGVVALTLLAAAGLFAVRRQRLHLEARSRFLNELAHDLRTPVTSIRLYAEMLVGGRVTDGARADYLSVMARESERLSGLLGNLLDLTRLEAGGPSLSMELVSVAEIVDGAVSDFVAVHPERGGDLEVDLDRDVVVRADRSAAARCLTNLLDNAGKHTPPGTAIRVSCGPAADGRVRIVVSDDGPGVPGRDRARIFRRYERGERAKRGGIPGTGLGLSLVKDLAESMGGTVALLPSDRGAAFQLELRGGEDA